MKKKSILSRLIESYLSEEVFIDIYKRAEEELRKIDHPFLSSFNLYNKSVNTLKKILSSEQAEIISKIEELSLKCCRYSMSFSFKRGVCAAFEKFYIRDLPYNSFDRLVTEKLFEAGDAEQNADYCDAEREMLSLYMGIESEDVCTEYKEYFQNIFDYHDDMILSTAAVAFMEGVEQGAAFLREIFPNDETLNCIPSSIKSLHNLYAAEITK